MRLGVVTVFALLALAGTARALQPIHVINRAADWRVLKLVEAAALHEANNELAPAWQTPEVAFRSYGWSITLEPIDPGRFAGFHNVINGRPRAVILMGHTARANWTTAFTHELVEMLVDPYINREIGYRFVEVCDPVQRVRRRWRGIAVADFVLPSWYTNGPGPWDQARKLKAAGEVYSP